MVTHTGLTMRAMAIELSGSNTEKSGACLTHLLFQPFEKLADVRCPLPPGPVAVGEKGAWNTPHRHTASAPQVRDGALFQPRARALCLKFRLPSWVLRQDHRPTHQHVERIARPDRQRRLDAQVLVEQVGADIVHLLSQG